MPMRESAETAHDLNNQLMRISSVATMALLDIQEGVVPPSLEEDLGNIVDAVHRSARLVYQLQASGPAVVAPVTAARERL